VVKVVNPFQATDSFLMSPELLEFFEAYLDRTKRSREVGRNYRTWHADIPQMDFPGRMPVWEALRYPIVVSRSAAAEFVDVDGNSYVDLDMGHGAHLLGHQHPVINSAIEAQCSRGFHIGPQSDLAGELAASLCKMTGADRVAFVNSGTEAVMTALRLARAVTGRGMVVIFSDAWHGSFDGTFAHLVLDNAGEQIASSSGTPHGMVEDVLVLDYGEDSAVFDIAARIEDIAAVLVEPVPGGYPAATQPNFLKRLRAVTQAGGAALIFDEVVSGFRLAAGGAQEWAGVRADIAVYGGSLGGGLPIGAVAGRACYLDAVDGGQWSFDDESEPVVPQTMFAGTFSKHPLAMAASAGLLKHVIAAGPAFYEELATRTRMLADRLNAVFAADQLSVSANCAGSILTFDVAGGQERFALFRYGLIHDGVYIAESGPCFLSPAHTDKDLVTIVTAARTAAARLPPVSSPAAGTLVLSLTPGQQELWLAAQTAPSASDYHEILLAELTGEADIARLRAAFQRLTDRHDALRAGFGPQGAEQRITPAAVVDFAAAQGTDRDAAIRDVETACEMPFDLTTAPLMRVRLISVAPMTHILGIGVHHLVVDGWSFGILFEELDRCYRDPEADMSPAGPYARLVSLMSRPDVLDSARTYWREMLPDALPVPCLARDAEALSGVGVEYHVELRAELWASLCSRAAREGSTPFVAALTAVHLLLLDISDVNGAPLDAVPVAIHAAGQCLVGDVASVVGYFVSMLPVVARLGPGTIVTELLAEQKRSVAAALEHPCVRFGVGTWRQPLTVSFNLEQAGDIRLGDLRVMPLPRKNSRAHRELSVNCITHPSGCLVQLRADESVAAASDLEAWAADYVWLLGRIAEAPEDSVSEVRADLNRERIARRAARGTGQTRPTRRALAADSPGSTSVGQTR
jgi:glutamate-1-semialdehyde aminotransferase